MSIGASVLANDDYVFLAGFLIIVPLILATAALKAARLMAKHAKKSFTSLVTAQNEISSRIRSLRPEHEEIESGPEKYRDHRLKCFEKKLYSVEREFRIVSLKLKSIKIIILFLQFLIAVPTYIFAMFAALAATLIIKIGLSQGPRRPRYCKLMSVKVASNASSSQAAGKGWLDVQRFALMNTS